MRRARALYQGAWASLRYLFGPAPAAFWGHLGGPSGLRGYLVWCAERYAFAHRANVRAYRRWFRAHFGAATAIDTEAATTTIMDPAYTLLGADQPLAAGTFAALLATARDRNADMVYTDEDVLSAGQVSQPRFKPDFSPDLLYALDYLGPVALVRHAQLQAFAQHAPSIDASPYSLALWLAATGGTVAHAAGGMVHHAIPRDWALSPAQRTSLQRFRPDPPRASRLTSIIIPTRDRVDLLAACLRSLYHYSAGTPFEVLIVDNDSIEPATLAWLDQVGARYTDVRVIRAPGEFNWSRLNNAALPAARGDVLLLLNNDIEAQHSNWLAPLVQAARRPDIGTVGALLTYPDGAIQHAGIVVGIGGVADHVYAGTPADPSLWHPFINPYVARNVLACTGACLAIERAKFERLGRLDEAFRICGDLVLGLMAHAAGLRNLYEPQVQMMHHESATRRHTPIPKAELGRLQPLLAPYIAAGDPFYSRALDPALRYPSLSPD